jgi:hypothetical protein
MITEFFVIDGGAFMTNKENGRPLMGIGERAGKAMLKNQSTVHTIWPYDAPNPIDDGKPPGKKYVWISTSLLLLSSDKRLDGSI